MNDLSTANNHIISNTNKKHAHFLKIYIKADKVKLSFPPIPLICVRGLMSIALSILKLIYKKKQQSINISELKEVDILELLNSIKYLIKDLKNYPPFSLIDIETNDTKIIIKTK